MFRKVVGVLEGGEWSQCGPLGEFCCTFPTCASVHGPRDVVHPLLKTDRLQLARFVLGKLQRVHLVSGCLEYTGSVG